MSVSFGLNEHLTEGNLKVVFITTRRWQSDVDVLWANVQNTVIT